MSINFDKKTLLTLFLVIAMTVGTVLEAVADITIKVNIPGVVTFISHIGDPDRVLEEETNVFTSSSLIGELVLPAEGYTMTCKNETSGEAYVVDDLQDAYKVNLNPSNVNDGDVIDVNVIKSDNEERTFTVLFDNPDAGYVVTLTDYDIYDSCIGENPLESNEDEYFWPNEAGEIEMIYEYNRRIRIRPSEGFSIVKVWNENETNPHYEPMLPNRFGVVEIYIYTLGTNHVVRVKTAEHGMFSVRGEGNWIEDIQMVDNTTFETLDITSEFFPVEYTGQTYVIRSLSSTISKIEVTNGGHTEELVGFDGNYGFNYTPNKGDELVIFTSDNTTGIPGVDQATDMDDIIYDLNGVAIPDNGQDGSRRNLSGKIYIKGGKKFRVK